MGRVVMGGRRTSVTFHNVITDTKHEKPLAVFLSNVIPTSTWVTFKNMKSCLSTLSNVLGVH